MTQYPISREFSFYAHMYPSVSRGVYTLVNPLLRAVRPRRAGGMSITETKILSSDGHKIPLTVIRPDNAAGNTPCLVYYHGGGFLIQAALYHYKMAERYAAACGCTVILADYRLTTHAAYPLPAEDCYAAFTWARSHADELQIDSEKIAVGGDSAGGCLAASVALMLRDRLHVKPSLLMLMYPVLDRRMQTESMKNFTDTPMWNSRLSEKMWHLYAPERPAVHPEYASPAEAPGFSGLPPAYIETAEFDCLHDEAVVFAAEMSRAGSAVDLYETKATMHGFDVVLEKSPVVRECVRRRIQALCRAFGVMPAAVLPADR